MSEHRTTPDDQGNSVSVTIGGTDDVRLVEVATQGRYTIVGPDDQAALVRLLADLPDVRVKPAPEFAERDRFFYRSTWFIGSPRGWATELPVKTAADALKEAAVYLEVAKHLAAQEKAQVTS